MTQTLELELTMKKSLLDYKPYNSQLAGTPSYPSFPSFPFLLLLEKQQQTTKNNTK